MLAFVEYTLTTCIPSNTSNSTFSASSLRSVIAPLRESFASIIRRIQARALISICCPSTNHCFFGNVLAFSKSHKVISSIFVWITNSSDFSVGCFAIGKRPFLDYIQCIVSLRSRKIIHCVIPVGLT